ncbi:hypothetical protein DBR06_SOUSAS1710111, partial [Sousa chinensis]
ISKKFLPGMAYGYYYPKMILPVQDGLNFMKQNQKTFDVITNSSKIYGPRAFLKFLLTSSLSTLHPDGIFCCQDECQLL